MSSADTALRSARNQLIRMIAPISIFSFAINILLFVSPVYMLQIYDRILTSRSVPTLVAISVLAFALLGAYSILEFIRSRCLARLAVNIDAILTKDVMGKLVRAKISSPTGSVESVVADVDRLREFVSGPLLVTMADMPWVPLYLALCYLLNPWLGVVATMGAVLLVVLALANELRTRHLLRDSFLLREIISNNTS